MKLLDAGLKRPGENDPVRWSPIAAFYAIACICAFPFNSGFAPLSFMRYLPAFYLYVPAAFGLAIGAAIFWKGLGGKAKITLLGSRPLAHSLFCLTPVVALALVGFKHRGPGGIHRFGLTFGFVNLLYAVMEEAGWRGYLQNALRPLPELTRYLITGLLWWPWHMRFATKFDWFVFPVIVMLSAWGLGKIAEQSRSFLVSAGIHLLVIVTTNTAGGWDRKWVVIACCLPVWYLILKGSRAIVSSDRRTPLGV